MKNLLSKAAKWIVSVLMVLVMCPTAVTTVNAEGDQSTVLNDFVTKMEISGVQENNGTYTVLPDNEYEVSLYFAETSSKQFANTMTYTFPTGFNVLDNQSGSVNNITVVDGDQTYLDNM
jgi:hypothetical protein